MRVKLPEGRVQRWVRGGSTLDQDKERKVQGQCPERPQVAVREPCPEGRALTWGPFLCRHLPEQRGALALQFCSCNTCQALSSAEVTSEEILCFPHLREALLLCEALTLELWDSGEC